MKLLALPLLLLAPLATLADAGVPPPSPRAVVLGIAQDGGMPQAGCDCSHCAAARRDPALVRHVASLAIHVPKTATSTWWTRRRTSRPRSR